MTIEAMLAKIPYLVPHALAVAESNGELRVRMPFGATVTNHVGIVHAGALFTTAETAAGVAAWRVVPGDRAFVLLRGATVRYTRRAEGEVMARASVEPQTAESARTAFEEAGRADAAVSVSIRDHAGDVVFEGKFDYALRPRRDET